MHAAGVGAQPGDWPVVRASAAPGTLADDAGVESGWLRAAASDEGAPPEAPAPQMRGFSSPGEEVPAAAAAATATLGTEEPGWRHATQAIQGRRH